MPPRTAALKCRQRKKAWLSQLQAKVEFLQTENERLTSALVSSREEIARLSSLVSGGAGAPGAPGGMGQMNGVGPGGQPISVNVSLPPPGKNGQAIVGGGRGYGY